MGMRLSDAGKTRTEAQFGIWNLVTYASRPVQWVDVNNFGQKCFEMPLMNNHDSKR
jgi:hypothetical protein